MVNTEWVDKLAVDWHKIIEKNFMCIIKGGHIDTKTGSGALPGKMLDLGLLNISSGCFFPLSSFCRGLKPLGRGAGGAILIPFSTPRDKANLYLT